jgi:hypothetical protein
VDQDVVRSAGAPASERTRPVERASREPSTQDVVLATGRDDVPVFRHGAAVVGTQSEFLDVALSFLE